MLGGGAIGLELAQAFARFGSRVTVVEAAEAVLSVEEPEAGHLLAEVLRGDGLTVHTGAQAEQVAHTGEGFSLQAGGSELRAQRLLVATGRRASLGELGVDALGIDPGS